MLLVFLIFFNNGSLVFDVHTLGDSMYYNYIISDGFFFLLGCVLKSDADKRAYKLRNQAVPNLRMGVLPLFCPVNSKIAWDKFRLAHVAVLVYNWYVLQRGLGNGKLVGFTPSGAFWCKSVVNNLPSNRQLIVEFNKAMTLAGITDKQELKACRKEFDDWCAEDLLRFVSAERAKQGRYVEREVVEKYPAKAGERMAGRHGGWEFIRLNDKTKFEVVHAVAFTASFLGLNSSDVRLGDTFESDLKSIEVFLPYIMRGYVADVYTAVEIGALYRMFSKMKFTVGGKRIPYSKEMFINHIRNLWEELGYDRDYLLTICKDPRQVSRIVNDFYEVDGVHDMVTSIWARPGGCLGPSEVMINHEDDPRRVATWTFIGKRPGKGKFKLFWGWKDLSYKRIEWLVNTYMLSVEDIKNEYRGLAGVELYKALRYHLGIYNMICPYFALPGGKKLTWDEYRLITGHMTYDTLPIEFGVDHLEDIKYSNLTHKCYPVYPELTPSHRYYVSLNIFFEDILGLHGKLLEYDSNLLPILDGDKFNDIVGRDNDTLSKLIFKCFCDGYADSQLELFNKYTLGGKNLTDAVPSRKGICIGYLYYEYLVYKRMGELAYLPGSLYSNLSTFEWCVGGIELEYLGYQKEYELNRPVKDNWPVEPIDLGDGWQVTFTTYDDRNNDNNGRSDDDNK